MIRINLLPREGPGATKVYMQIVVTLAIWLVSALALIFWWMQLNGAIAERKAEKAQKEREVQEKQASIKKAEEFQRKIKDLEQKLDTVKDLYKQQRGPVKLLDELAKRLAEQMWLTSLKVTGKNVQIQGQALSMASISDFLKDLKANSPEGEPYFTQVRLEEAKKVNVGGTDAFAFRIVCNTTL